MADVLYTIIPSANGAQHSTHPLGDFDANQQPPQIAVPVNQYWYGDSQINGRGYGSLTTSNVTAFRAFWSNFFSSSVNTSIPTGGVGGRGLQATINALLSVWNQQGSGIRPGPEWVHFVETGDQNQDGQRTATDYANTVEWAIRAIRAKSPNCLISTETPFSFGREGEQWRDWTTYKTAMLERIALLNTEGFNVRVVDNDGYINALEGIIPANQIWYPAGHTYAYHFTDVGNLMTAVGIWWTLGYDISQLNFASILAQGFVTQTHVDAILQVINNQ